MRLGLRKGADMYECEGCEAVAGDVPFPVGWHVAFVGGGGVAALCGACGPCDPADPCDACLGELHDPATCPADVGGPCNCL